MRVVSVLLVLVIGFAVMPVASAIGGNPVRGPLHLSGCHGYIRAWTPCMYAVTTSDPTILFFRRDFDDNGICDFPNQAGGGNLGKWSTLTEVMWVFTHGGVYRVCVQGWDVGSRWD